MAKPPADPEIWKALPRITTDIQPEDLPSAPIEGVEDLDKTGAWSLRWLHEVRMDKTGGDACRFLGALPTAERKRVMAFYRGRYDTN